MRIFRRSDPCGPSALGRAERANVTVMACVILVAVCLGVTGVAYVSNQRGQAATLSCVANWADAFTARADKITDANDTLAGATLARDTAEDRFLAELRHPLTAAQKVARFDVYLDATAEYQRRVAAYEQTLTDNPIPPSPRLNC